MFTIIKKNIVITLTTHNNNTITLIVNNNNYTPVILGQDDGHPRLTHAHGDQLIPAGKDSKVANPAAPPHNPHHPKDPPPKSWCQTPEDTPKGLVELSMYREIELPRQHQRNLHNTWHKVLY